MSVFNPIPVAVGAIPAPVTVQGATPAGCALINRGDNGGTLWLTSGPGGPAIPLTPGGSLTWTDQAVFPYVQLATGATAAETLLVTDQAADYANPAAVAAATAVQLAAQGLPSTFLDTGYGSYSIPSGGSSPANPIDVSKSATLVVSVYWPQPTPLAPGAVQLKFTDPAIPDLSPVLFYLTNDNPFEASQTAWQVPVGGPRLTITNVANTASAAASVSVVGTNRVTPRFRQLGDEMGARTLGAACPTGSTLTPLVPSRDFPGVNIGGSAQTRFNGPVTLQVFLNAGTGFLQPQWVDYAAGVYSPRIPITGMDTIIQWAHPSVPVHWSYFPNASVAGNYVRLAVLQATG